MHNEESDDQKDDDDKKMTIYLHQLLINTEKKSITLVRVDSSVLEPRNRLNRLKPTVKKTTLNICAVLDSLVVKRNRFMQNFGPKFSAMNQTMASTNRTIGINNICVKNFGRNPV